MEPLDTKVTSDVCYLLNDQCYKYFHNETTYDELEKIITSQSVPMFAYISYNSPNYSTVTIYFSETLDETSPKNFDLMNTDDVNKLLSILKCRVYSHERFNSKYMVGFNIWSYHQGYRLIYARKYGYEQLFKEYHPYEYQQDIKQLNAMNL